MLDLHYCTDKPCTHLNVGIILKNVPPRVSLFGRQSKLRCHIQLWLSVEQEGVKPKKVFGLLWYYYLHVITFFMIIPFFFSMIQVFLIQATFGLSLSEWCLRKTYEFWFSALRAAFMDDLNPPSANSPVVMLYLETTIPLVDVTQLLFLYWSFQS